MTDTLSPEDTAPVPDPPPRRRIPVLAVIAGLAIVALAVVAVVVARDNGSSTMMGTNNGMPGSMTSHGTMMGSGPMMSHGANSPVVPGAREIAVHVAAAPGTPARGGLHAPATPGRFTVYCTVAGHRQAGMTGVVIVDPS
jgi:uncharacterized cupredoxin-like copper-binding protein